jgi:hypothetical protein
MGANIHAVPRQVILDYFSHDLYELQTKKPAIAGFFRVG